MNFFLCVFNFFCYQQNFCHNAQWKFFVDKTHQTLKYFKAIKTESSLSTLKYVHLKMTINFVNNKVHHPHEFHSNKAFEPSEIKAKLNELKIQAKKHPTMWKVIQNRACYESYHNISSIKFWSLKVSRKKSFLVHENDNRKYLSFIFFFSSQLTVKRVCQWR